MSIRTDVYAWVKSLETGSKFCISDYPNHSFEATASNKERLGLKSAVDYGLCIPTGNKVRRGCRGAFAPEYRKV